MRWSNSANGLLNLIEESAQREHVLLNIHEVRSQIRSIVDKAFWGDQMQEIQKTLKHLSA